MEWQGKSFLRRWHFSWDLHVKEEPDIQRTGSRAYQGGRTTNVKALRQDWAEHEGTERKWEWLGITIKEVGPAIWAGASSCRIMKKTWTFVLNCLPSLLYCYPLPVCGSCSSVSKFYYFPSLKNTTPSWTPLIISSSQESCAASTSWPTHILFSSL